MRPRFRVSSMLKITFADMPDDFRVLEIFSRIFSDYTGA
jgi:hypothetical protein